MAAPSPSQLPFGRCVEELDTDHGHIATVRLAVAKQPHTSAEQTHFYRWGWLQGEEGQAICWEGQEDTPPTGGAGRIPSSVPLERQQPVSRTVCASLCAAWEKMHRDLQHTVWDLEELRLELEKGNADVSKL